MLSLWHYTSTLPFILSSCSRIIKLLVQGEKHEGFHLSSSVILFAGVHVLVGS